MTALATLLADPEQPIAFVAELTYRDPDTDVEATVRITTANWEGTEAGYLRGLLLDPGTHAVSVEGDELGGIASLTLNTLRFTNVPPSVGAVGPLDFLRDQSLSGRSVKLLAGSPTEAIAEYEAVGSGLADGEPEFDTGEAIVFLRLKAALEVLRQDLDVNSYVGEPSALKMLTSTGVATATDNAAHHLTTFTLTGRFWHPAVGATNRFLSRRLNGAIQNWNTRLLATTGLLNFRYTHSSGTVMDLTSAARYDDDETHWWAVGFRAGHQYLMIDGEIVAEETTSNTPDTPTGGVVQGATFQTGAVFDHRILDHYLTPDEARTWMATRASGDEDGLVGLWRGDDNSGNTLTDYSTTAAHATISGTEDVAFEWVSSDLGSAELAGQSMLAVLGSVWNFFCTLVDSFRERWRASDRTLGSSPSSRAVRDEGEELTATTDYTWTGTDAVIQLVAEAGEPVTAATDFSTTYDGRQLLTDILVTRGPLESSDLDLEPWNSLTRAKAGLVTERLPVAELARSVLAGSMGYLTQDTDGTLRADALIPPTAPSPRGGSCVEIIEGPSVLQTRGIEWSAPAGALTGRDFTIALWIKSHYLGPPIGNSRLLLLDMGGGSALVDGTQLNIDLTFSTPTISLYHFNSDGMGGFAVARAPYSSISDGGWHFIAAVHDHTGSATRIYAAPEGGALSLLESSSALSYSAAPASNGVRVGGRDLNSCHVFRGSPFEPSVWDEARSLVELQAQMDDGLAGNETNLAFYAPLDGTGAASLADTVSAGAGSITGDVRERPDVTYHLDRTPRQWTERQLVPAHRIEVKYRRNYALLGPEQIAATVPDGSAGGSNERLDLQREWRSEVWEDAGVLEDYLDAREIEIDTPWHDRNGARATMRIARARFVRGRRAAVLGNAGRRGLLLAPGDEVRVYGHQELATGPVYRVTGNARNWNGLDCELRLWR